MQAPLRLALLVVLALLGFAANSVLARLALGDRSIGAAAYTGVRLLAGAATLAGLVAALLCVVSLALEPWHWSGIGWAIVSGALASGVGYAIWYAVLPSLSRVQSGIVQLCVPAIAAGAGIVLLGEQPTLRLGIATVLILGGVAVAITVRPKAP